MGWSQTFPEGIAYQSQVFGSSGQFLSNATIGVEFNIRQTNMNGTIVWQETHVVTTNELGHIALVIGQGTPTGTGTVAQFSDIPWADDTYFLEMLVDENNIGLFVSAMTQQLMAVPFAFHAKTTSQEFQLSELLDVDTTGLSVGDILEWNGTQWVPGQDDFTTNSDTAQYALLADSSTYADTAGYASNCIAVAPADTAFFAYDADTANHSLTAFNALYADSAGYADSAAVANYAINNWGILGNDNTDGVTNFLGTIDSVDFVIRTDNTERMRFKANGQIGIGTLNPNADFHVNNTNGVLYTGTFGTGTIPIEGAGTRMMWYPGKASFRAGHVTGTVWNDVNIGQYSLATGYNTTASGDYSSAFGHSCTSSGEGSFSGGFVCLATGDYSIALGQNSQASGLNGVAIGRGCFANATGAVAIGYHPEVYADYGLGFGNFVRVYGTNGVAMGYRAQCDHDGAFLYADQTSAGWTYTNAPNQFMVKSSGGAIFYTSSNLSTGVTLPAGGGAWSSLSDRNSKENIVELEADSFIDKLDSIDVYRWNYITQDSSVQHIGPMAQDFYAVFGVGEDSTMINTIDFDGVNMILLKALYQKSIELEEAINRYEELNKDLEEIKQERLKLWEMIAEIEEKLQEEENEQESVTTENVSSE